MGKVPTWGLIYWPIFMSVVIGGFLSGELPALFTNHGNTLSYFAQYELGSGGKYTPHNVFWWISLIGFSLITAVLIGHIWFRTPD